jgi:hypothetical protein
MRCGLERMKSKPKSDAAPIAKKPDSRVPKNPLGSRQDVGDSYLPLKTLAAYAGLSVRTLRAHLGNRCHPLPCYRVGGKILVRRQEYDLWAEQFRVQPHTDSLDALVDEIFEGLE